MMHHEFEQADKGIYGWIQKEVAKILPRQALVTRPDGKGVWVRYTPVDATARDMWFPSTVAGLTAGTTGWVIALGGGKGLFVATGIAAPVPFNALVAENRYSTSTISTFDTAVPVSPSTLMVPPGKYRVKATAIASGVRTVDTGSIVTRLSFGGVVGPESIRVVDGTTPGENAQVARFDADVDTDANGIITVEFHVRGNGTAATTRIYKGVLNGTLTRIG